MAAPPSNAGSRPPGRRLRRVFLLSPARVNGVRAGYLLNPGAAFALGRQFHREGLPVAEVFSFTSGLYFRGKITYARRFAAEQDGCVIRVITPNAGLVNPSLLLTAPALRAFGEVDIDADDPRYREPLRRDARALARRLAADGTAVLLGSIATGKYRDVLLEAFGTRLVFPSDFVGRGDMSRGGLLLRSARDGVELPYVSVLGATVRGARPPRLPPLPRAR
ncbi:MAG: hypothetical protein AB1689_23460 [Thermodesulfobacteriota bacterium]